VLATSGVLATRLRSERDTFRESNVAERAKRETRRKVWKRRTRWSDLVGVTWLRVTWLRVTWLRVTWFRVTWSRVTWLDRPTGLCCLHPRPPLSCLHHKTSTLTPTPLSCLHTPPAMRAYSRHSSVGPLKTETCCLGARRTRYASYPSYPSYTSCTAHSLDV